LLRIGITGGIGSGKSTVCQIFRYLGIPVYEADKEARRLMREDASLIAEVKKTFGEQSYAGTEPNRIFLAEVVFSHPDKLKTLNGIVHPRVFADFERWSAEQNAPYVIKEAAIMFETNSHLQVNSVVVVAAPLHLRIDRTMKRDNISRDAVHKRIAQQLPQEDIIIRADHIIHNDDAHPLIPQILRLHRHFLKMSQNQP
jgi:dephospho-CoA kinase